MDASYKLIKFLRDNIPADSPLMSGESFAHDELNRDSHLKYARALKFFRPMMLVKVQLWDPLMGDPGLVLEDIRVIYDPENVTFAFSSIDWINSYRATHSLDIKSLSGDELRAYIIELISMVPRADRWGVNIEELQRKDDLTYSLKLSLEDDFGLGGGGEELIFLPHGGIKSFPYMEDDYPVE